MVGVAAAAAMLGVVFSSCTASENEVTDAEPVEVLMAFQSYDVEPITRAAVGDYATRLDVWVFEDGSQVQAVHQTSADADFGSVAMTLDKRKTYTLYALAHKSADETTLTDGVAQWTGEKVTHTFFYSETFSPATVTELSCAMSRIVGMFRLLITDEIPSAVAALRFDIPQAATRYNIFTGTNTNVTDRTTTIAWNGTGNAFVVYILSGDDGATLWDITVSALDADGGVLQQRVFEGVPIRNGYRTQYQGSFFIDEGVGMSFTVGEWNDYDVVEF